MLDVNLEIIYKPKETKLTNYKKLEYAHYFSMSNQRVDLIKLINI